MATKSDIQNNFRMGGCNNALSVELSKMCAKLKKQFPGVWTSECLKSLERLAEHLPLLTDEQVDPTIVAHFQPLLWEEYTAPARKTNRRSK
jgi:hypothetical protein